MAFTKGRTKTGGRKKGVKNKLTVDLREKITNLLKDNFDQVAVDIQELTPKERVTAWIKLLEYSLPKLQRTETTVDFSKLSEEEAAAVLDRLVIKLKEEQ